MPKHYMVTEYATPSCTLGGGDNGGEQSIVFLCYLQCFFFSSNSECLFQTANKHGCTGKDWADVWGWLFLHLQEGLFHGEQAACPTKRLH